MNFWALIPRAVFANPFRILQEEEKAHKNEILLLLLLYFHVKQTKKKSEKSVGEKIDFVTFLIKKYELRGQKKDREGKSLRS